MALIALSNGGKAIIDDHMTEFLSAFKWNKDRYGYARATLNITRRRKLTLRMHRVVIGAEQGQIVDHVNRNRLDNRIANLRIVTAHESASNTKRGYFIGLPGVTIHKQTGKFQAALKGRYLGLFTTAEEAHQAFIAELRMVVK